MPAVLYRGLPAFLICYTYTMKHILRIGVLRGGPSNEYDVSLKSGAGVLSALRGDKSGRYHARDIFIDKAGNWHIDGFAVEPHDLSHRIDVAFNALHGTYGEDGKVQSMLEAHGIPFTGSGSLASAVGMNKVLTKKAMASFGIKSPYGREVPSEEFRQDQEGTAHWMFTSFLMPAVVKPAASGSSVGVSVVRAREDWLPALAKAAEHGETILIEEFIPGIEATCGVIEGFRGKDLYALPVIEIRSKTGFFDYDAKYKGLSEEIIPATFSAKIKDEIEKLAMEIHRVFGLRHYSRSDFIVHPRRGIYALEVNTLPGLTEESLVPKAMKAVGSNLPELVDHLIALSLQ
jgi:D-alanine-D-alanine ligase